MKKMNNKGFTLIELLAVVVILLAISSVAISSISAAMERNRNKQDEAKIEVIISYARLYYDEYKNAIERDITEFGKSCFSVDLLNLSEAELKKSDNSVFDGYIVISGGANNSLERKFEYKDAC